MDNHGGFVPSLWVDAKVSIRAAAVLVVSLTVLACSSQTPRFTSVTDIGSPVDAHAADAVADTPLDAAIPDVFMGIDVAPIVGNHGVVLPGAPADSAMRFGGTVDPTRAPSIVYPADATIVPPNLPGLEVHFYPGAGNDLFDVTFTGDVAALHFYTPCVSVGGGCILSLDTPTFAMVSSAGRTGSQVHLSIRGTSRAGGSVGVSPTQTLGVTQTDLRGAVYYWVSAGDILRYDFGNPAATNEIYALGNVLNCAGCHVLSRDGTRISIGFGIPAPAPVQIYDVTTRAMIGASFPSNFGTFSPDNRHYIASDGQRLTLLDGTTGTAPPGTTPFMGSMPDWHPNGTSVVYALPAVPIPFGFGSPGHSAPADLDVMAWNGTTLMAPHTLVHSSGENNYYPSYAPDGAWVVFNRSAGTSYNAPDAHLWAVRSDGSGAPIDLATGNGPTGQNNSWPKWAPFVETYGGELTEPLMWITFTSNRNYGLRLQQPADPANRTAQLWMTAFRPGRAGADPTSPAFWLPFQGLTSGNHIAQWAPSPMRTGCDSNGQCAATEVCSHGVCVGPPP